MPKHTDHKLVRADLLGCAVVIVLRRSTMLWMSLLGSLRTHITLRRPFEQTAKSRRDEKGTQGMMTYWPSSHKQNFVVSLNVCFALVKHNSLVELTTGWFHLSSGFSMCFHIKNVLHFLELPSNHPYVGLLMHQPESQNKHRRSRSS